MAERNIWRVFILQNPSSSRSSRWNAAGSASSELGALVARQFGPPSSLWLSRRGAGDGLWGAFLPEEKSAETMAALSGFHAEGR